MIWKIFLRWLLELSAKGAGTTKQIEITMSHSLEAHRTWTRRFKVHQQNVKATDLVNTIMNVGQQLSSLANT